MIRSAPEESAATERPDLRHPRGMQILRGHAELSEILIHLTRDEAAELRDAVEALLEHFHEPGYHAHVSSSDYRTEMTLAPEIQQT